MELFRFNGCFKSIDVELFKWNIITIFLGINDLELG